MAASAREGSYVVIEPGTLTTRYGRSEYQYLPSKTSTRIGRQPPASKDEPSLLVGCSDLDALLAKNEQVDNLRWPISNGKVVDWAAFEDLLKYLVVKEIGVRRATNDSHTLVCLPLSWPTSDVERLVQIMFETLNVPGLFVAESPLMALYGCGLVTGLVIDIGHETTDIAAVLDSVVSRSSAQTLAVGGSHVHAYLRSLLEKDALFMQSLGHLKLDDQLVKALMESGVCRLFNAKERTRPPLSNSIKRVDWEYQGVKLSVGLARYQAFEILFQPQQAGLDMIGIVESTYLVAMGATEALDKRFSLWESVLLTGGVSVVPGLQERFENELNIYLSASETSNEFQAKEVKFVKLPEFFSAYKEGGADSTYLGGTITARLTLNAPSQHITKSDYNEMGPSVYRFK